MEKMPRYVVDAYVDLTGKETRDTTFSGCILHMGKGTGLVTKVIGCKMDDCQLAGEGWPKSVLVVDLRR